MVREDKFVLSHRPYAVGLGSFQPVPAEAAPAFFSVSLDAVWFRRRRGVTMACVGYLWAYRRSAPSSVHEFLESFVDGTYGGTAQGRWDGERYWGAQEPETMERHLSLLRPMLAGFPAVPDGYDGWWTFQRRK